jgi:hypothetical protein
LEVGLAYKNNASVSGKYENEPQTKGPFKNGAYENGSK